MKLEVKAWVQLIHNDFQAIMVNSLWHLWNGPKVIRNISHSFQTKAFCCVSNYCWSHKILLRKQGEYFCQSLFLNIQYLNTVNISIHKYVYTKKISVLPQTSYPDTIIFLVSWMCFINILLSITLFSKVCSKDT